MQLWWLQLAVFILRVAVCIAVGHIHSSGGQLCLHFIAIGTSWWCAFMWPQELGPAVDACTIAALGPRAQAPAVMLAPVTTQG